MSLGETPRPPPAMDDDLLRLSGDTSPSQPEADAQNAHITRLRATADVEIAHVGPDPPPPVEVTLVVGGQVEDQKALEKPRAGTISRSLRWVRSWM